jgi:hypothetical protein
VFGVLPSFAGVEGVIQDLYYDGSLEGAAGSDGSSQLQLHEQQTASSRAAG